MDCQNDRILDYRNDPLISRHNPSPEIRAPAAFLATPKNPVEVPP